MKRAIRWLVALALIAQTTAFAEGPAKDKPKPAAAENLLKAGLERAAKEDKRVFLKFARSGCIWCEMMDLFLNDEGVKPFIDKAFVLVTVDINENEGAASIRREALGLIHGGVPSYAFLDADRNVLTESAGIFGNLGFPESEEAIASFKEMLEDAQTKLAASEIESIIAGLRKVAAAGIAAILN